MQFQISREVNMRIALLRWRYEKTIDVCSEEIGQASLCLESQFGIRGRLRQLHFVKKFVALRYNPCH